MDILCHLYLLVDHFCIESQQSKGGGKGLRGTVVDGSRQQKFKTQHLLSWPPQGRIAKRVNRMLRLT
jgi:hypothetical protein